MAKPDTLKLPAHFEIEVSLQEQLSNRPGHQRCMEGASELLLVLHELPQPGPAARDAWFFWKRNDGRWTQPGGPGINQLSELLARYETVIAHHIEALERVSSATQIFAILRHASPLARTTRDLVHALEQALGFEPDDRDIRSLRDRARDIERAAELLLADARIFVELCNAEHQEAQAKAAERLRKMVYRVSLLAAILIPFVALVVVFGMNVSSANSVRPLFWGIVLGVIFGSGVSLWLVKRQAKDFEKNSGLSRWLS